MLRELREAWRIVRIEKKDGYKGPYVVLRETMMEELQKTYGWALAENKGYAQVIDAILNGAPICKFCEDESECKNHDRWLEGRCKDFLLRFPDEEKVCAAFEECYKVCDERSHQDDR
jgi:hypothetical protein